VIIEREEVRSILERARDTGGAPDGKTCSLQGMGMFRLYLSREVRLHVWDSRFIVEKVSTIHTHPWDFLSHVLSGVILDRRFCKFDQATSETSNYLEQEIVCGPGGGASGRPTPVRLKWDGDAVTVRGYEYIHSHSDIHETVAKCGTVTLVERKFKKDTEHALVYFRKDRTWVSAEPRPAREDEVKSMARMALDRWEA